MLNYYNKIQFFHFHIEFDLSPEIHFPTLYTLCFFRQYNMSHFYGTFYNRLTVLVANNKNHRLN